LAVVADRGPVDRALQQIQPERDGAGGVAGARARPRAGGRGPAGCGLMIVGSQTGRRPDA
ncbi:hypothetical protein MXD63_29030, partial [Frankia sp. Cpl3]|nr:hypothetical protein [Frankia sp. Cpl3]